jgi:uncharacterized membrane protein YhaH (DUF805 family)
MEWYVIAMQNYAQFNGRSRRREFWIFALANAIVCCVLYGAGMSFLFTRQVAVGVALFGLCFAYAVAVVIPGLSCGVRRLHDIGKSGWFMLLPLIPLIGGIVLIVLHLLDSQPGPNQYGPNPKFPVQPVAMR